MSPDNGKPVPAVIYAASRFISAVFLLISGLVLIWAWPLSSSRHLAANLLGSYIFLWGLAFLFLATPKAEMIVRFSLTTVSMGVIWVGLEAASMAGVVDFGRVFGTSYDDLWPFTPGNALDTELLWVRVPDAGYERERRGNIANNWCLPSVSDERRIEVAYDRNGFRNAQELYAADIAVIGDSYVEAAGIVNYEETVSYVLAEESGLIVANLGRAAYGPRQQLVVLRRYALPLKPRAVIWAFYEGNDLADLARNERIRANLDGMRLRPTLIERSFANVLLDRLHGLLRPCEPNPVAETRYGTFRDANGATHRVYFQTPFDTSTPQDIELARLPLVGSILREAYDLVSGQGGDFIVVFVPQKLRVYADAIQIPLNSELREVALSDLPTRFRAMVEDSIPGAGFLDLTTVLAEEARRGQMVYWADDTHWTAQGNRVAASAIWQYLEARQHQ